MLDLRNIGFKYINIVYLDGTDHIWCITSHSNDKSR